MEKWRFLATLLLQQIWWCCADDPKQPPSFPLTLTIRAPVLLAEPMAYIGDDDDTDSSTNSTTNLSQPPNFVGYQIDLIEHLKEYALQDGVELNFILGPGSQSYDHALNLIANDCNTTENPNTLEDCTKYDMIIGDYWPIPTRWDRVDFTPAWWRIGFASMKFTPAKAGISTLEEASRTGQLVCVLENSAIVPILEGLFPDLNHHRCGPTVEECAADLRNQKCILFPWDDLTLGYFVVHNPEFVLTKERVKSQSVVWPMRRGLDRATTFLINKWLYKASFDSVLDELYRKYYSVQLCPIGKSGENCDLPCDPDHGRSNAIGECICDSIRWTGSDCSEELQVDLHLIPLPLKVVGYVMFGINVLAVMICLVWLQFHKETRQVKLSQPFFLHLVLLGCVVSSATIITM